jgi:poly(hydroxyalkanoate) depolymerase family esterase
MEKTYLQKIFAQTMHKSALLTGMGKLVDISRQLQRSLLAAVPQTRPQVQAETKAPVGRMQAPAASDLQVAEDPPQVIILPPPQRPAGDIATPAPTRKASFTKHQFVFEADTYPYRLYIPPATAVDASADKRMPLVVLLHGCKQDTLDFSNGTAMNALADEHHALVLYPEQITRANAMRCWNWFEPGHQQANRGEPGMIAALTQSILQKHGADPERVYIAGLSAGGAMAALMAGLYPNIFAAVGVHSGLAAGAANDVMSAFAAMRSGAKGSKQPTLPTIIFHGSADKTVHPDNSQHITEAALAGLKAAGLQLVKTASSNSHNGGEKTERLVYSTEDGTPYIENWRIDGGAHAWSGGDAIGSYTDPDGPSASAAMLAFFLQHRLRRN